MSTVKTNNVQIGQSATATNNFTWYQPASPDGTVRLGNGNSGAVTDAVTVTSAGNVGIGTSSPYGKLHTKLATSFAWGGGWNDGVAVFGGGGLVTGAVAISYNDTDGAVIGAVAPGVGWKPVKFYSDNLIFATNGASERMRITAAGNVLIGTSSLAAANWVNEIKNTTTDAWPLALNATTRGLVVRNSSATSGFHAYFEYNGGTNNGSISWSGGTTAYNTTSDARIKENIVDAPEAGSLIDAIQVRSWDFKADGAHWRYGMVAQELLPVVPEAVSVPEDPEMMMGVDYSKLVPMLVKEIQSLRARLAALEAK